MARTSMRRARFLRAACAAAALLLAAGCVTTEFDAAPLEATCGVAVVRGHRAADVADVARLAEELDPLVRAIVRPRDPEPPRIVVQPQRRERCADAATTTARCGFAALRRTRYIALCVDDPAARRYLLAHELVHWYADWAWEHVPIAVEEGLAELVATRLAPCFGAQRAAFLAQLGPLAHDDVRRLLQVARGRELALPPRAREQLYLAGRDAVGRLGVERVRAWCDAVAAGRLEHIPLAWFAGDAREAPAPRLAVGGP